MFQRANKNYKGHQDVPWVKAFAINPVNLSWIPGTHIVKRQNSSHKLSPASRAFQPITDLSLKTWSDCKPMVEGVECPWEEPATVILLNGHSILLPNKSCPYPIDQDSSWPSLQETLSNRELHIHDHGMVSPARHLYQPPPPPLPGLREHTRKEGGRVVRDRK